MPICRFIVSKPMKEGAMKNELTGAWELVSGQPLPKGARDIKLFADGHFMFTAYDTKTGTPLYSAGGTYKLSGSNYTEYMAFASEKIAPGLVSKDQSFTIEINGNTLKQSGTLSNGKPLEETFRRLR